MADEIEERVFTVIARTRGIARDQITLDCTFEDLDIDSLAGVNIVADLEELYGLTVPDEILLGIRDVRGVVQALRQTLANAARKPDAPAPA
jgi:acyl carrier protein